jgi:cytochrome c556
MKRRAGITLAGALLALGLWSLTAYSADDDDEKKVRKEAQGAVIKLMDSMNGGKGEVKAQAETIRKKFDMLEPVMWVYKPSKNKKGGIGMGKDGAGIENELNRLSGVKARPNPAKDAELKKDLIKVAEISRAIAEVTDLYAGQYAKKDMAKWKRYTKDMKKGADQLIEAAKGGNPAQVKKAITELNSSCTNCHSDFR